MDLHGEFPGASGYKFEGMRNPYVSHIVDALSSLFKAIIWMDCLEHEDLQEKLPDGIVNVVQSDIL